VFYRTVQFPVTIPFNAGSATEAVYAARRHAQRGLCHRAVTVRLSVCLSRSCIVSKRVTIFSNFFIIW